MKLDYEKLAIREEVLDFFNGDKESCEQWLNSSLPALGGKRPTELLEDSNGRAQFMTFLQSMKTGDFG